jgi:hypothetical protein
MQKACKSVKNIKIWDHKIEVSMYYPSAIHIQILQVLMVLCKILERPNTLLDTNARATRVEGGALCTHLNSFYHGTLRNKHR